MPKTLIKPFDVIDGMSWCNEWLAIPIAHSSEKRLSIDIHEFESRTLLLRQGMPEEGKCMDFSIPHIYRWRKKSTASWRKYKVEFNSTCHSGRAQRLRARIQYPCNHWLPILPLVIFWLPRLISYSYCFTYIFCTENKTLLVFNLIAALK